MRRGTHLAGDKSVNSAGDDDSDNKIDAECTLKRGTFIVKFWVVTHFSSYVWVIGKENDSQLVILGWNGNKDVFGGLKGCLFTVSRQILTLNEPFYD